MYIVKVKWVGKNGEENYEYLPNLYATFEEGQSKIAEFINNNPDLFIKGITISFEEVADGVLYGIFTTCGDIYHIDLRGIYDNFDDLSKAYLEEKRFVKHSPVYVLPIRFNEKFETYSNSF